MDLPTAYRAINARWIRLWPAASGNVPFCTDNNEAPEAEVFARISIISGDSSQSTLGSRKSGSVATNRGTQKIMRTGIIDVRLTGPIKVGRGPHDALFQVVADIFETRRFGHGPNEDGITTHATTPTELRRDKDAPQLWIMGALTPFEYYERP